MNESMSKNESMYNFSWVGKNEAAAEADLPTQKKMFFDEKSSFHCDNTNNIYIEGDNLDALKLLLQEYENKIRMIYIDPPYNTGNNFTYNDNFNIPSKEYNKLNTQGMDKINSRLHSAWCSMIYPRLKLAQKLLSEDGVIFISIGDNEVNNLRKICDEVFGENNFITQFIFEKTQHFGRQKLNVYSNVDYILCYAKLLHAGQIKELLVERINNQLEDAPLFNASNNVHTLVFPANTVKFNIKDGIYTQTASSEYELVTPVEVKDGNNHNEFLLKFRSRWSPKTVLEEIEKGTTFIVKTDSFAIRAVYSKNKITNVAPKQIIFTNAKNPHCTYSRFGRQVTTSETATKDLAQLMEGNLFTYPKPLSLIEYLISLIYDYKTNTHPNDFIVLDFFSGSATTAHACMNLNLIDNGKRKFIMVQKQELLSKNTEAYKLGYTNICEIGKERIRRAGKLIKENNPNNNLDIGFKVYKI